MYSAQSTTDAEPLAENWHEQILRAFVETEGRHRTAPTIERYHETVDRLLEYLDNVDVGDALGEDVQRRWKQAAAAGQGFLATLGFDALVHVIPGFLDDPWLPPAGIVRSGRRSLIDRLLVHLRREGLIDVDNNRAAYRAAKEAVRKARSRDYGWRSGWDVDPVFHDGWTFDPEFTVAISLPFTQLEYLRRQIDRGPAESLSEVVAGLIERDRTRTADW